MFKNQLEKVQAAAGSVYALWVLGVVSFLESAILPIPVDLFALPVMMANRKRLWQAALVASIASIAGGCLGYLIGAFLMDTIGNWVVQTYGLQDGFANLQQDVSNNGVWAIAIATISPIPYKLAAIAAGAVSFNFGAFLAISAAGRSIRFFALAGGVYILGPALQKFITHRSGLVSAVIIIGTIAGFLALAFLK